MKSKVLSLAVVCLLCCTGLQASKILIPMDEMGQANHLKAYGIAIAALNEHIKVDWLLNYQGGSYGFDDNKDMEQLCKQRGVTFTILSNHDYKKVLKEINSPKFNGAVKTLEKAPKIAVYTPPNK